MTFRGRDATREVENGSCRLVRIGDISPVGTWLTRSYARIEPAQRVDPELFLQKGDVLFPNRGTRTTAVAFDGDDSRVLAGAQFFVIRPRADLVDPRYLAWCLRSDKALRHFAERRKGTHVQVIERDDLACFEVSLPPLQRQLIIVEAALLSIRERQLADRLAERSFAYINSQLAAAADAEAQPMELSHVQD